MLGKSCEWGCRREPRLVCCLGWEVSRYGVKCFHGSGECVLLCPGAAQAALWPCLDVAYSIEAHFHSSFGGFNPPLGLCCGLSQAVAGFLHVQWGRAAGLQAVTHPGGSSCSSACSPSVSPASSPRTRTLTATTILIIGEAALLCPSRLCREGAGANGAGWLQRAGRGDMENTFTELLLWPLVQMDPSSSLLQPGGGLTLCYLCWGATRSPGVLHARQSWAAGACIGLCLLKEGQGKGFFRSPCVWH